MEQPRWAKELMYGSDDFYQRVTAAFAIKADLTEDEIEQHLDKVQEEIDEIMEAFEEYQIHGGRRKEHLAEEICDGIHILFVLANILDIEVKPMFKAKSLVNLSAATGERDDDGFVEWSEDRDL